MKQKDQKEYYREQTISEEAKREIAGILMREKHAASEITDRPAAKKTFTQSATGGNNAMLT